MRNTRRVEWCAPAQLVEDTDRCASSIGISRNEYVTAAVSQYNSRGVHPRGDRELVALRCDGSPWDHMEHILAKRLTVADLCDATHKLQPGLRKALKARLTEGQARRYELVLSGYSYSEIAKQEGCIKQAVGQSIAKANRRLLNDESFKKILVNMANRQLPEEFTVERAHAQG